jgi:hypothetical protein
MTQYSTLSLVSPCVAMYLLAHVNLLLRRYRPEGMGARLAVKNRIKRAGVRLAHLVNEAFK